MLRQDFPHTVLSHYLSSFLPSFPIFPFFLSFLFPLFLSCPFLDAKIFSKSMKTMILLFGHGGLNWHVTQPTHFACLKRIPVDYPSKKEVTSPTLGSAVMQTASYALMIFHVPKSCTCARNRHTHKIMGATVSRLLFYSRQTLE
uniref:Uncharacterized protein n=1 Tax=Micrurus surinamensis TaxID=129470 RepID=A0A2D4PKZ6_MICSU